MTDIHKELITLIIAYTCVGVFVATAVASVLNLFNVLKLAADIRKKLHAALIIEIVAIAVGVFGGLLRLNPQPVANQITQLQEKTRNLEIKSHRYLPDKAIWELVTAWSRNDRETALKLAEASAVDKLFSAQSLKVNSQDLTCYPSGTGQRDCQIPHTKGIVAFRLKETDQGWWVESIEF
jgi:hypothetical protein